MPPSPNNIGQIKFPPNPKHWSAERNGHALRSQFRQPLHLPLTPFEIARNSDGVKLLDEEEFESFVGASCVAKLLGRHRDCWSGFVVPVDSLHVIVINFRHPPTRQHATLSEELFHIRLGHKPCRLSQCPVTGLMQREYTPEIEHDAYWSAAAALVPYGTLRAMLASGETVESIAEFFGVSIALVQFRMNVTKLARRHS